LSASPWTQGLGRTAISVAEWKAQYWKTHWHALIDHLADGRDAESFFAALPGKPKAA